MSEDVKTTIAQNLTGSVPMLATVLGAGFMLLGLAGGITYAGWMPVSEIPARILSGLVGLGLVMVGLSRSGSVAATKPLSYGVKILYPAPGSRVDRVDVGGSIGKELPPGYCLRVFRIYPGSNRFTPLNKARIKLEDKTWVAEQCHVGGISGDQRFLAVYLCGPSAEALTEYHNGASAAHRETMNEFKRLTGTDANYLPSIDARTTDMHECDRVSVIRS